MRSCIAKSKIIFLAIIFFFGLFGWMKDSLAATYYISPGGNNTNNGLSSGASWKTFSYSFSHMTGGDTLVLLDGTYSDAAGTGYMAYTTSVGTYGEPPNGTSKTNMTIVTAQNSGSVTVSSGSGGTGDYALFVGRSSRKDSYIKIEGITFEGGGGLYNTSYVYIKNCGFHAARQNGGDVFGIGTNDGSWGNSYNLIEDVWVWGKDRIIASNYMADNNVWRRVVVRGDGCGTSACNGSGNPNVGITAYNSQNVSLQNIVVINRVLQGSGNAYADFSSAQHSPGASLGPIEWLGDISLNSPDCGWYLEADSASANAAKIINSVVWDTVEDGFNVDMSTSGLYLENLTAGDLTNGDGLRCVGFTSGFARNIISHAAGRYGLNCNIKPSYTDTFGAGSDLYNQTTPTVGVKETNPLADGTPVSLKYLPRIESGSALKGTGNGGADYGANVVKQYGVDGAFHGDTDYNTLSAMDLWPWPNEDRIKTDFASVSGGARGFATGTSRDGSSQTLTKYIWEYLGHQIPADIYGISSDTTPPANPTGLSVS